MITAQESLIPMESDAHQHILAVAALFDNEFSIDWIQELTQHKPSQILMGLEAGLKQGWLKKSGPANFTYKSPKRRELLENRIESHAKEQLRHNVVEILIRETADENNTALAVARHLLHLPNDVRHCRWLLKAGSLHRNAYRHQEASQCYTKIIGDLKTVEGEEADLLFIDAAIRYAKLAASSESLKNVNTVLQDAMLRAEKGNYKAEQALLEMEMASNEWLRNRFAIAFRHFERGWSITKDLDDYKLTRSYTTFTNFFHMWEGRYREVVRNYEVVEPDIVKYPRGRFALQAGVTLGFSYAMTGQVTQGLGMLDAIRSHCRRIGDVHTAGMAGYVIGVVLIDIGKVDDALQCLKGALEETVRGENRWARINATLYLAFAYHLKNQSEKAASRLRDFLRLRKPAGVVIRSPVILDICWAITRQIFPPIAGLSLEKEINIAIRSRNLSMKGIAYKYKALLQMESDQPLKKAIRSLQLSQKWLQKSGVQVELAKTQIELVRVYLQMKESTKAIETMHKAAEILSSINQDLIPDDLRPLIKDLLSGENLLEEILQLGQGLVTIRDNKELVRNIISTVNRITGAERGAIFLRDHGNKTSLRAAKNLTAYDITLPSFADSMEMIQETLATGKGRIRVFAAEGKGDLLSSNVIRSCICVPMKLRDQVVGVLYHDNRLFSSAFKESDLKILDYFAAQAAIALDNAQAYEEIQNLNQKLREEKQHYEEQQLETLHFEDMVGKSPAFLRVLSQVERVAGTDTTVLILGETGVGKELLARAIHRNSPRTDQPFIRVNCSAFPETLISSELFGHEKGAFTGATAMRIGRFELADRGTLFLDEIGEIPLETQIRLLRVLQSKEFERVGGGKTLRSDFRLVAATNRNLEEKVRTGKFRADLYYRLNVFPIDVPPLRERREDIPLLAYYFLKVYAAKLGKPLKKIPEVAMQKLLNYGWSGNVRELENVVERSTILSSETHFRLPDELGVRGTQTGETNMPVTLNLKENERHLIQLALQKSSGKINGTGGAAELLGLHPNTLYSRMKKLGISKPAKSFSNRY